MAEETVFENGRISNFEGLVTLTLDRVTLHTVVYHSSTSTYVLNFIEIEETFCGRRTDVRTPHDTDTQGRTLRPALLGRLCRTVDLIINFHMWLIYWFITPHRMHAVHTDAANYYIQMSHV